MAESTARSLPIAATSDWQTSSTIQLVPSTPRHLTRHPDVFVSRSQPSSASSTSPDAIDAQQKKLYLYLRSSTNDSTSSPAALRDLRELHDTDPTLRTTQSYNLLVGYAIRQGKYRVAETMFQEMVEANCTPNTYTWRLKIRLHLAQGHPELAYNCASEGLRLGSFSSERSPGPVPFSVWAQLLRPGGSQRQYATARPSHTKRAVPQRSGHDSPLESLALDNPHNIPLHLIFAPGFFPTINSFSALDYRTAADVVAFLRSHGKGDIARQVTLQWISSLPKTLALDDNARVFHVINRNLHDHIPLSSPRSKGHKVIKRIIHSQLDLLREAHEIRPQLYPTHLTVHQLLRATRLLRNPGEDIRAVTAILEARWPGILDFEARIIALGAILKDEAPYRCRALVETLVWELDHELAVRKRRQESGLSSNAVNVGQIRGQTIAKYFATKAKARRLGILNDKALERIREKLEASVSDMKKFPITNKRAAT